MQLYTIECGTLKLDGGAMFGVIPKELWQKQYSADENNLCTWSMRALLVVDDKRIILFDTGIGDKLDEKMHSRHHINTQQSLNSSLAKVGISHNDITDVVVSHLHFDHCGGNTRYDQEQSHIIPTFQNATYWISKKQWECALNPSRLERGSYIKDNFVPLKAFDQVRYIDSDFSLTPSISFRLFHGHTPGQIVSFINLGTKKLVYAADVLPSRAHIPIPYIMAYDIAPLVTVVEKEQFLIECATKDYTLFLEHDLYAECCSLGIEKSRVVVRESFSLKEYVNN